MTAQELRKKFINFFVKRGHREIPNVSLVPEGDPTVLFTTAGMHPLVPYLLGEPHPQGKRLVNVQRCLRTDDIEEVGDATHLTFFEMLGNWSLGDPASPDGIGQGGYWKEEAISWSFEFLTRELEISLEKLAVTVFAGDEDAPRDTESKKNWEKLGIPENRIFPRPKKDNWWGPVGVSGPCGPDTEIFVWAGNDKPQGVPNENDSWVEVWNDVFMEYERKRKAQSEKRKTGEEELVYEPLKQKNVDTGMGLERILMVLQGKESVYETDAFSQIMEAIGQGDERQKRIIADHLKASVFLVADGVLPGNKDREYILRRLVRRAVRYIKLLGLGDLIKPVAQAVVATYKDEYPSLVEKEDQIKDILTEEAKKFERTLSHGLQEIEKLKTLDGKVAFYLYETFGFPLELAEEIARERGQKIDKKVFEEEFKKHQELSRTATLGKFTGGLADHQEATVRGHTATHLLHQALRDVLGQSVHQTGSNITPERIRFDFSWSRKLTNDELKRVEDIVNQKVNEDLPVHFEMMRLGEAKKIGAVGLFEEKYGEWVKVYFIGGSAGSSQKAYSKEFCGGPHVTHTARVGHVRIVKEEALASGQRRIYMQLP